MRNHNHRPRRYHRSRNNGRGFTRNGSSGVNFIRNNVSSDTNSRRIFRGNQNASKLLEKYLNLGKEALSSGDKILSENYFQHADHFSRIVESKKENLMNTTSPVQDTTDATNTTNDSTLDEKKQTED